jgi:hypothetical protein
MGIQLAGSDTQIYWEMPNDDNDPVVVENGTGKLFVVTTPDNHMLVSFFLIQTQRATLAAKTRRT